MTELPASETGSRVPARLTELLEAAHQPALTGEQLELFSAYGSLIIRWNTRMNLTAIRDEEGILSRHFLESIACARAIPAGIATVLDFGSGAGFPGIPIAICRPEIAVTLAESQGKKAAFLREAVRTLHLAVAVHAGRAEELRGSFDCVALRAVDRMEKAIPAAAALVNPKGLLALMTTETEFPMQREAAGADFSWLAPISTPQSATLGGRLLLALGRKNPIIPRRIGQAI